MLSCFNAFTKEHARTNERVFVCKNKSICYALLSSLNNGEGSFIFFHGNNQLVPFMVPKRDSNSVSNSVNSVSLLRKNQINLGVFINNWPQQEEQNFWPLKSWCVCCDVLQCVVTVCCRVLQCDEEIVFHLKKKKLTFLYNFQRCLTTTDKSHACKRMYAEACKQCGALVVRWWYCLSLTWKKSFHQLPLTGYAVIAGYHPHLQATCVRCYHRVSPPHSPLRSSTQPQGRVDRSVDFCSHTIAF